MTRTEDVAIGDNSLKTVHERKVSDMHQRLKILEEQKIVFL
jgi:N-acetylmuramoyl-L-alanine amidase